MPQPRSGPAATFLAFALVTASGAPAAEAPAVDAWPPVVFTLELVEALDRRDSIRWAAIPYPADSVPSREAMAREIRAELAAKYPPAFLRRELRSVHVVSELRGGGKRWGGLHWGQDIVVTAGPDGYLLDALHHEVAGLLLEQHANRFPRAAWRKASEAPEHPRDDVSYLPDAGAAPATGPAPGSGQALQDALAPTEELARLGFVSPYGKTTEDNDVEEYLRVLFRHPGRLLELASRHERVRTKLRLTLDFLEDISSGAMSPAFHAEWMRKSNDEQLRAAPGLLRLLSPPGTLGP